MREATIVACLIGLTALMAYIGSYYALAVPSNTCNPEYPEPVYIVHGGSRWLSPFYYPAHSIDRVIRSDYWENRFAGELRVPESCAARIWNTAKRFHYHKAS